MRNDTAVFNALRLDPESGQHVSTDRTGTREAIARDGLVVDTPSLGYCPHEWIDPSGYVDLELARRFPHPFVL